MPTKLLPRILFLLVFALPLAFVAAQLCGQKAARQAVLARADALETTATASCAAGRHTACADDCERAAALAQAALDVSRLDRLEGCVDRARALEALSSTIAPAASDVARLTLVGERLSQKTEASDRALGAALVASLKRQTGAVLAARVHLEKAAQDGLDSPWLQWQTGLVALMDARLTEAQAALEHVVAALPEFGPATHQLGLVYLAAGRKDAALTTLRRAAGLATDPQISLDLARAFLANEMWAEAIEPLETVLRGRPAEVDAVRLLAMANHNLRRYQAAAALYRKAWDMDREPRTLLSAALALQAGGLNTESLDLLTSLLPVVAQVPEIRFVRAAVLANLARPEESRSEYQAYIAAAAALPGEAERVKLARERLGAR